VERSDLQVALTVVAETMRHYLTAWGSDALRYDIVGSDNASVFGGRGPGGVLSAAVTSVTTLTSDPDRTDLVARGGDTVAVSSEV
jgi:hypothetical protein